MYYFDFDKKKLKLINFIWFIGSGGMVMFIGEFVFGCIYIYFFKVWEMGVE